MRPSSRSNFQKVIAPRYFSLYSLIGAYSQPSGVGVLLPSMTYSVLGVTKAPPWSLMTCGFLTICLVLKSRRSITATRALALSLMNRNWPS